MSMPIHCRCERMCGINCGATTAERVKDDVAFVTGGFYHTLIENAGGFCVG